MPYATDNWLGWQFADCDHRNVGTGREVCKRCGAAAANHNHRSGICPEFVSHHQTVCLQALVRSSLCGCGYADIGDLVVTSCVDLARTHINQPFLVGVNVRTRQVALFPRQGFVEVVLPDIAGPELPFAPLGMRPGGARVSMAVELDGPRLLAPIEHADNLVPLVERIIAPNHQTWNVVPLHASQCIAGAITYFTYHDPSLLRPSAGIEEAGPTLQEFAAQAHQRAKSSGRAEYGGQRGRDYPPAVHQAVQVQRIVSRDGFEPLTISPPPWPVRHGVCEDLAHLDQEHNDAAWALFENHLMPLQIKYNAERQLQALRLRRLSPATGAPLTREVVLEALTAVYGPDVTSDIVRNETFCNTVAQCLNILRDPWAACPDAQAYAGGIPIGGRPDPALGFDLSASRPLWLWLLHASGAVANEPYASRAYEVETHLFGFVIDWSDAHWRWARHHDPIAERTATVVQPLVYAHWTPIQPLAIDPAPIDGGLWSLDSQEAARIDHAALVAVENYVNARPSERQGPSAFWMQYAKKPLGLLAHRDYQLRLDREARHGALAVSSHRSHGPSFPRSQRLSPMQVQGLAQLNQRVGAAEPRTVPLRASSPAARGYIAAGPP